MADDEKKKSMAINKHTYLPLGLVVALCSGLIAFTYLVANVRADVRQNTKDISAQGEQIKDLKSQVRANSVLLVEIKTILTYGDVLKPKPKEKKDE